MKDLRLNTQANSTSFRKFLTLITNLITDSVHLKFNKSYFVNMTSMI